MPDRNGTGPPGGEKGMGRGRGVPDGQCPECGKKMVSNAGSSAGGVGWEVGAGPGGFCVCLKCKREVKHVTGIPCTELKCPNCGIPMARKL